MQIGEQLSVLTGRVVKALGLATSAATDAASATEAASAASTAAADAADDAAAALAATTDLGARVDALEAFDLWRSLTQAALANTYFTIESLGTIAAGEYWTIDATVAAGTAPSGGTSRQATTVRLIASVTRPSTGAAGSVNYTASSDGGTLAGWSTGVRISLSGNTVLLEGRATNANTLHVRWRRAVAVVAI